MLFGTFVRPVLYLSAILALKFQKGEEAEPTQRERRVELCVPWQGDERLEFDHSSFSDHSLFCSTL